MNTNSSGGSNGLGEVTFNGGTSIFEDDDIIVFEVENPTADGEIGNGSSISGVTVFDNYADYQSYLSSGSSDSTKIKYNYAPQNPGQSATVQSDISGLGDSYVRFNANILQAQDGGPALNDTLTIAPGTNIANASSGVTIDRVRSFDIDENGVINSGTVEEGNSEFYVGDYVNILDQAAPVPCFTEGTLIKTPKGDRLIESLCVGDLIETANNGAQPIVWIGKRTLSALELKLFPKLRPVRIRAGSLGQGLPKRDLLLSRQHRVLIASKIAARMFGVNEVLIPALRLVGMPGIETVNPTSTVTYIHILLGQHEIIHAEGAPSESLYLGCETIKTLSSEAREEVYSLFPELSEGSLFFPSAALIPHRKKQHRLIDRHKKNKIPVLEVGSSA